MMFFGRNFSSVNPLKCISVNNQECKVRPEIFNVNSDERVNSNVDQMQVSVIKSKGRMKINAYVNAKN